MDSKKRIILAISTALVLLLAMFIIIKIPFGSKAALQPKTNENPATVSQTAKSSDASSAAAGSSQIKVVISKADSNSSRAQGTTSQTTNTASNAVGTSSTTAGSSSTSQTASSTTPASTSRSTQTGSFSTSNLVGMDCLSAMRQAEAAGYSFSILNLLNRDGSQVSESETDAMINNGTLNASIIETSISGNSILVNAMLNE